MATQLHRKNGTLAPWNNVYSPARGTSLWEDCPILEIMQDPTVGYCFFDDFFTAPIHADTDDAFHGNQWTITGEAGYTMVSTDVAGGVLTVTGHSDNNDGVELQLGHSANGECFKMVANKPLWFEARLAIADVDKADFLVGLCTTDTDLVTDAGDFVVADGGVFFANDHDGNIDWYTEASTTETTGDTGFDAGDGVYFRPGFVWDGAGTVRIYINGLEVAVSTTNVITGEIRPSLGIKNTDGTAMAFLIDWMKVVAIR